MIVTVGVLAGYFAGELAELAGAVVLTAGRWIVGLHVWRDVAPAAADRWTRVLLAVSALVLVATMLLALDWAAGQR